MSIQTKLQEKYKYYLSIKALVDSEVKELERIKKSVAERADDLFSIEEKADVYFEAIGETELLKLDLLETKKELYYYVQAYNDLLEIPADIISEVRDFKTKVVFAVVDGKKEVIDKELYESYKKQHLDYSREVEKYLESQK